MLTLLAAYCVWHKYYAFAYYRELDDSDDEEAQPPLKDPCTLGPLSADTFREFVRFSGGKTVLQHFRDMDEDNSGMIAMEEFAVAVRKMGFVEATREECEALFTFYDVDGSGAIPYAEIDQKLRERNVSPPPASAPVSAPARALASAPTPAPPSPSTSGRNSSNLGPLSVHTFRDLVRQSRGKTVIQHFRDMDKDESGAVTKKEFGVAVRTMGFVEATREQCDALFSYLDVDGSGSIPYAEIDKKLRAKPPPASSSTSLLPTLPGSPSAKSSASPIVAKCHPSSPTAASAGPGHPTVNEPGPGSPPSKSTPGSPATVPASPKREPRRRVRRKPAEPTFLEWLWPPAPDCESSPDQATTSTISPTGACASADNTTAKDFLQSKSATQPITPGRTPRHASQRAARDSDGNTVWERLKAHSPRRTHSPGRHPDHQAPVSAPVQVVPKDHPSLRLPSLTSSERWDNAAFFPFTWPAGAVGDEYIALDTPAPRAEPEKSSPPRETRVRRSPPPPLPDSPRSARWRSERHRSREQRHLPWRMGTSPQPREEGRAHLQPTEREYLDSPPGTSREAKEPKLWSFSSALNVDERVDVLRTSMTRKVLPHDTFEQLRMRVPWFSARAKSPQVTARGQNSSLDPSYGPLSGRCPATRRAPRRELPSISGTLNAVAAPQLRTDLLAEQRAQRQQLAQEDLHQQLQASREVRDLSPARRSAAGASGMSVRASGSRRVPGSLSVYCGHESTSA